MRVQGLAKILLVISFLMTQVGCNEMAKPQGSESQSSKKDSGIVDTNDPGLSQEEKQALNDYNDNMGVINIELDTTEIDVEKVLKEIAAISLLALVAEKAAAGNGKVQYGLKSKLKDILEKLLNKLAQFAAKKDTLKIKLMERVAKLDPLVQAVMYEKIQLILSRLDVIEEKVSGLLDKLEEQVAKVVVKIDELLLKADFKNPLHIYAYYELIQVKELIVAFKNELGKL